MSFIDELKRRNVLRVAIAYIVTAWLLLQVADVVLNNIEAPDWVFQAILLLVALGFPFALIFAWAFELTPEGLKREHEVDRSESITYVTGRKLDFTIIGVMAIAIAYFLADKFVWVGEEPATTVAISEERPIVAVLPFKATGSDDGGFLAGGLHDDLLTRLAKLDAFKVISRTSMMEYGGTTKNMRQIGDELGAGYILEGGVQALGNRVRINAQLIDATADEHIWADTYDRELTAANLFDVQAELAMAIAGQLRTALTDSDRALMNEVPTQSTEAYNAYLRGLELLDTTGFSISKLSAVAAEFEEAVRLDPEFAHAWARLSQARSRLVQLTGDSNTEQAALAALTKARALEPDLQEVDLAWAVYLYRGLSEYEQALQVLEALSERSALNATSLRLKAWLLKRLGRPEEAYRNMLEAKRLEPRSIQIVGSLVELAITSDDCEGAGQHARAALSLAPDSADLRAQAADYELECTGDTHRASELLREVQFETASSWVLWTARNAAISGRDYERVLELSMIREPGTHPVNPIRDQLFESLALRYLGRDEDAAAILDAVADSLGAMEREGVHDRDAAFAWAMSWYHSMRGDATATRRWVEENRKRFRKEEKGDRDDEATNHFGYAANLAGAGLHDEAIAELRVMFEEPGGSGFRYVDGVPVFDVLKDHPGYIELRERFGDRR